MMTRGGKSSRTAKELSRHTLPKTQPGLSQHPLDVQLFDYLIVVDFECTCEEGRNTYPHEIIEFPGVLVDVRRGIVDKSNSFHSYVKPWRNPVLSEFCTKLTGIQQEQVDHAPSITEVVSSFVEWYRRTIPPGAKVVFATDGPWDFKNFLYSAAVLRDNVAFPTIFYEYIDVRTTFARHFNKGEPLKLDAMLSRMKLRFHGSPHCGFDDAYNIARLAVEMMKKGCVFQFLIALPLENDTFHYDLTGVPLYRRAEGSGYVKRDDVEEIAKKTYGSAYFEFGQGLIKDLAVNDYPGRGKAEGKGPAKIRNRLALRDRLRVLRLAAVLLLGVLIGAGLTWYLVG